MTATCRYDQMFIKVGKIIGSYVVTGAQFLGVWEQIHQKHVSWSMVVHYNYVGIAFKNMASPLTVYKMTCSELSCQ